MDNATTKKNSMKELVAVKTRNEKHYWTRIGVAYENQDGSWNLRFDYLPADLNGTTVQLRDFNLREGGIAPLAGSPPEEEEQGIAGQPF